MKRIILQWKKNDTYADLFLVKCRVYIETSRTLLPMSLMFLRKSFRLQENDTVISCNIFPMDTSPLDKSNKIYATLKNYNHALLNWQG